ncbi:MAG TPA: hypothetical protein VMT99_03200 [Candidatus Paceibacterota bacterium]|nr:hypothetical protein [Candidatus Paceibacterota bacterium]
MPNGLKIVGAVLIFVALVVIGSRVYGFVIEEGDLSASLADIQARLTKAETDAANLQEESRYLANPVNLEKELRARFNYKRPGETMIIIVPPQNASATPTGTAAHP